MAEIVIEREGLHRYSWMKTWNLCFFWKNSQRAEVGPPPPMRVPDNYQERVIYMKDMECELNRSRQDIFVASINGRKQIIHKDEIKFIESIGRKVELHLEGRKVEMYSRMADMSEELGMGFFQIHRSFIVNLNHVQDYVRSEVTLSDGAKIPMSRHKYREFLAAYLNHWTSKAS